MITPAPRSTLGSGAACGLDTGSPHIPILLIQRFTTNYKLDFIYKIKQQIKYIHF